MNNLNVLKMKVLISIYTSPIFKEKDLDYITYGNEGLYIGDEVQMKKDALPLRLTESILFPIPIKEISSIEEEADLITRYFEKKLAGRTLAQYFVAVMSDLELKDGRVMLRLTYGTR